MGLKNSNLSPDNQQQVARPELKAKHFQELVSLLVSRVSFQHTLQSEMETSCAALEMRTRGNHELKMDFSHLQGSPRAVLDLTSVRGLKCTERKVEGKLGKRRKGSKVAGGEGKETWGISTMYTLAGNVLQ